MKRVLLIVVAACLVLLLLVRLCWIDIIAIPEGTYPRQQQWALVNRWAYGYRLPWDNQTRWGSQPAKRNDWVAYNRPTWSNAARVDTTAVCLGKCTAVAGDTVWYDNESGQISVRRGSPSEAQHLLVVPQKGKKVRITHENIHFYATTIMRYEPVKATLVNDSLCVGGRIVQTYTFQQDYYWVSAEHPQLHNDSQAYGFIPHQALVGRIM